MGHKNLVLFKKQDFLFSVRSGSQSEQRIFIILNAYGYSRGDKIYLNYI